MKSWLASRRTMATATVGGQGADKPSKSTSTPSTPGPTNGEHGAAAALDRLEEAEEKAFRALDEALTAGDPIRARAARKGWLDIAVVLAKLDSQVSESRRTAQELYPRETLEELARGMGYWLYITVQQALGSLVNHQAVIATLDTAAFSTKLRTLSNDIRDLCLSALNTHSYGKQETFPPWLLEAFRSGYADNLLVPNWQERGKALVELLDVLVQKRFEPTTAPTPAQ